MEHVYDTVIIGGGPGGYAAALYCARAGLDTARLEMMTPGGQMCTTERIDNYPGFDEGVDGMELGMRMQKGAERLWRENGVCRGDGARPCGRAQARGDQRRRGAGAHGDLGHRRVPRELGLRRRRSTAAAASAIAPRADGMFYRGKTVAVAGGGNSAAEDARVLSKLCAQVYVIHRRDALRASRAEAAPLEKGGERHVPVEQARCRIRGEGKLSSLVLQDTKTGEESELAVDGLFVAIGRVPNTALAKGQLELDAYGYVKADETTRTSVPGVFCRGRRAHQNPCARCARPRPTAPWRRNLSKNISPHGKTDQREKRSASNRGGAF